MSFLTDLLIGLSNAFRPHITFIASALVATLLVIYGNNLNRAVWAMMRNAHFLIRTLVFIILCAIGYGALTVYLIPLVRDLLLMVGSVWMGLLIVAVFILVGWLAERRSRRA